MIRCRTQDQAQNQIRLTFKTKSRGNQRPWWLVRRMTQDQVTDSRRQKNEEINQLVA